MLTRTVSCACCGWAIFICHPGANSWRRYCATSVFATHLASTADAPRGGDLMLRASNGSLRNLTQEAGFDDSGFQSATAIAVCDPAVHLSNSKTKFRRVIDAPATAGAPKNYSWQLYEVDLSHNPLTAVDIVKLANQPSFSNIHPNYLSDGAIVSPHRAL